MSKFKSFEDYNADPVDQYISGEQSDDFSTIKHLHPRFAFDFLSLKGSSFCFDSNLLSLRDYHKMLKGFRDISSQTYEVISREDRYHFHDIEWNKVTISKSDFLKCIHKNKKDSDYDNDDITAYQFKVFEEARVIGFIYKGIFYLVMFDRGHNAYKRKDKKKR